MFLNIIIVIIVLFLIMLFIVLSSRDRIKKLYTKYMAVGNSRGLTGKQVAFVGSDKLNLHIRLAVQKGTMIDAYVPSQKTLVMSHAVSDTASLASVAIVSHELGHAVQHKKNKPLFNIVNTFAKLTRFTNKLIIPGFIIGSFLSVFSYFQLLSTSLGQAGLYLLNISLVFIILNIAYKIATIPLEYDASKLALQFLKGYELLNKTELKHAKKLLDVAALTYMASLFDDILIFSNKVRNFFYKKH